MTVKETVEKAKIKLLLDHPFFASILLKRPIQEDESIKTALTDGEQIRYNPAFMAKLDTLEICAVFAHEILHIAYGHFFRQGGRQLKKWNYACDFAINLVLKDNRFKIPTGVLLDEKYRNMSAEKIYNLLPDEPHLPEGLLLGDVESPNSKSQVEKDRITRRVTKDVAEAIHLAKLRGAVPLGIRRLVETLTASTMDWREILSAFLTERSKIDYTFKRPNLNYLHTGFYLPSLESSESGRFLLAVDTSGSQENKQLQAIGNHILSILKLASEPLTVIYCDAQVAGTEEIDPDDPPEKLGFKGNGGTDFKPVAAWIKKNKIIPEVLIYFTDGQCDSFPGEPDYPVLWATDNPEMKAPYGEIIVLTDDEN